MKSCDLSHLTATRISAFLLFPPPPKIGIVGQEIPKFARCTFEDGWCGWENAPTTAINWTRHMGAGYTKRYTGPAFDHTYQNESGKFLYVNMSTIRSTKLGSSAILESSLINPPPRYHARPNSTYYKSCFVRFFYHQYGAHTGSLGLFLCEMDPVAERSIRLWFTYGNKGDTWQRQVVPIPTNITYKYYLQFEARRGFRARGDIAIDDVSMSPECFGLNVPEKEKEGYDYDNFSGFVEPTQPVEEHRDFFNKTSYLFSSCGVRGRMGPTPENCTAAYNNTSTNVTVLQDATLNGVQRWIVPQEGFYTIVVKGASGGKGYDGLGVSKGTTIVGVVELNRTQSLYILVGQEGGNACRKNFAVTQHYTCGNVKHPNMSTPLNPLKEIQNLEIIDDGGGGGGATFVFLWSQKNGRIPLIVGAGGGGLGGGTYADDGSQHGKGVDVSRLGVTGSENGNNSAGAGGGWTESNGTWREVTGGSFVQGAVGGKACGQSLDLHGAGGFGGGGGGCRTGGGGGGFAGGSASADRRNGLGGYSYVAHGLITKQVFPGSNAGQGSVVIIPAIKGCGCEFLCVALDEHRQKVKCICPSGSQLETDGFSCFYSEKFQPLLTEKFMTVIVGMLMILIISCLCYYFFKHNRRNKKDRLRLKMINESELQLNRLRLASDSMMTEYNPNYEFGGGTYTIRDLNEVPRENLRLVKALGQGAFGEVYQGFYRYRTGDIIEMPVAVKTLPELSTSQAETDFLMEALIMSKFTHPNIVHFIGVCFDKHPRFIVLELLAGGDLKNFLRESRPKPERPSPLVMKDLLMCAIDVAKGCAYLEEHRFIHRDIAARNCLLTTKGPGRTVKIADFGMARDIYRYEISELRHVTSNTTTESTNKAYTCRAEYYRKGGKAMLPIKWMPPEAFQDGIFTAKTDIWSFGVLLWEVMSLGYMPYTGCGNREVMQLVISGGRLEPPMNCPSPVYAIMTKCWHPKPDERPSFLLILERLGYCVQDPEVLNAPLPIFNRLPSSERDSTIMRPEITSNCLHMEEASDYLEPSQGASNRQNPSPRAEEPAKPGQEGNAEGWESNFTMPESQSTQPLLLQETGTGLGTMGLGQPKCNNHNNNNNSNSNRSMTNAISLDAGALVRQPIPYVNVKVAPKVPKTVPDGNSESPFSVSRHLINDAEISC
ncbi:hypothetical protein RUM43_008795 [Polyplax serrata]|uniref:receptor protein-tyrosine kinase n=1 Tax=Polyplax serrata TaxID=468196 RepID=A0AAN8PGP8_POLSC